MYPFDQALPIWHPEGALTNSLIEFQASVSVESPSDCVFYLHVNTNYALYINDRFVDCGSFADFPEERIYDTLSLKDHVVKGDNSLRLYAYYQGEDSFTVKDYPPEVIFSFREKKEELLVSAPGIPVRLCPKFLRDVPHLTPQLSFTFGYDAHRKSAPFMPAEAIASSCPKLYPRPVKKLKILDEIPVKVALSGEALIPTGPLTAAEKMQQSFRKLDRPLHPASFPSKEGVLFTDNDVILDLGKETVGFLVLDLELKEDAELLVGWGEHLEDGHVRTRIGIRNFAASLRLSSGRTRFFYPYKRMALRYLEIQSTSESFTLYYAGVKPVYYPLDKLIRFTCDDHLHQQIFDTSVRTLLQCMHEHYEDCPWREQALYTMDSRNQMLIGYHTFREFRFPSASLSLIGKSLRKDGYLELISPGSAPITIPSFTAIYLIQVAEYFKYSEDFSLIRTLLPICRKIADRIVSQIDDNGLIPREKEEKYWTFYEWQTGLDGHSAPAPKDPTSPAYDAPQQAFSVMALDALSLLETALGSPLLSRKYVEAAHRIRKAFHSAFFDPSLGCYRSFLMEGETSHLACLTQALAVCADLVPMEHETSVLHALAYPASISKEEPFYEVTLSHSIFKYEALLKQPETYTTYIFEELASQYGYMLSKGATTFWETIDGADAFDNAGSLCHGWSAVPAYIYMKYGTSHLKGAASQILPDPGLAILNGSFETADTAAADGTAT